MQKNDILLFCTLRNERVRLPYFLEYYRKLGINQFFFVDNNSDDGTKEYLKEQDDVSLWTTEASYKKARFGVDWMNWLLRKYGHNHWTLCVDVDEFFVYPFCDTRPIRALTDWLDASALRSFGTLLLDMYPEGKIDEAPYSEGDDPFEIANWFDGGNYVFSRNEEYGNLWIQGGARARVFFEDNPERAPALNKVPLIRWKRGYTYVSSTHMVLPRGLNAVYDEWGGEKTSGILLHAKFIDPVFEKSKEEQSRKEHYASGVEYRAYYERLEENPNLWCKWSERFEGWRQLETLGLMSRGNWA